MEYKILDKIKTRQDLCSLGDSEILELCEEIRAFLIDKVGTRGGHLASNLGVTELSVALHRVFDSPRDHIIFDVGHQAYVHKMLTGRKERFDELRIPGGLSGFTSMRESEHDAFGAGHSSTSISAALGYAEGDKIMGRDAHTVCIIGDGAYTGGMVHEAINNCKADLPLVIILNENGMSISANKGAFASYLSRVRASGGYRGMKERTDSILSHIPLLGRPIRAVLSWIKNSIKRIVFRPSYFEELGFYYLGPIDGNDYKKVEQALIKAKDLNKCVFVHIKTTKGKGYPVAEEMPEVFHSISSALSCPSSFHAEAVAELISMAEEDNTVSAITAAMGVGTGLTSFEKKYPDRYFDVGIAEEHALTFAAGLAAGGIKPYCAIYSTFLQRGYDNIVHDIALQGLPVRMLIDRAGLSVADGATHHGIFDVAFLSHIPGVEIISPATYSSLRRALRQSLASSGPVAIRYPNSEESALVKERFSEIGECGFGCDFDVERPPQNIIITYGTIAERALIAADMLRERGVECGVVLVERIKPFEPLIDFISHLADGRHLLYAEEGIKNGGAAMITAAKLRESAPSASYVFDIAAIDDNFVIPDKQVDIYDYAGLSPRCIAGYFIGAGED